ncbi:MAG: type IX secretion system membrane protein PorP/SprF [Endomicrobia bacterium]|nr:type IX secretion system membrane protein PorP/SprF [Endomicrobiia bacterium]
MNIKRKMEIKKLVLLLLLNKFFISKVVFCAFQYENFSVRANSLGGSFCALSDEPAGVYYNPAGIINSERGIQLFYSKPLINSVDFGINISQISFVHNLGVYSIGISASMFNFDNLYLENIYLFSFAFTPTIIDIIDIGFNLKVLGKNYNLEEIRENKYAVSFDCGLIFQLFEKFSVGTSLKNINQPDISISQIFKDNVPIEYCIGCKYSVDLNNKYVNILNFIFDLKYETDQLDKINYSGGIESYLLNNHLSLRVGLNRNNISFGFGYYRLHLIKVDFGFEYSTIINLSDFPQNEHSFMICLNY